MANTLEKWLNHIFSSGCDTGQDYDAFQRAARADLRKQAKAAGYALHKFNPNHYEFSAVLRDEVTGEFVYISISDVRYSRNEWYTHVLYRTMAHDKDWTGGFNQYCRWSELTQALERMRLIQRKESEEMEETGYYDEVGGYHISATGYAPTGKYCGECTSASCKNCPTTERLSKKTETEKEMNDDA